MADMNRPTTDGEAAAAFAVGLVAIRRDWPDSWVAAPDGVTRASEMLGEMYSAWGLVEGCRILEVRHEELQRAHPKPLDCHRLLVAARALVSAAREFASRRENRSESERLDSEIAAFLGDAA